VVTEPETRAVDDEAETLPPIGAASPAAGGAGPTALAAGLALPSPLAALPGGAAAGTMVHRILERVDTASGDLPRELLDRCREVMGAGSRADGGPARFGPVDLAAALDLVLATPLGPLAHDLALRDIPPRDRLAELEFEFPLGGGDAPPGRAAASLDAVARLLRRHLPPTDLFAGYAHRLEALGDAALRGYLTGSIDAVLRLRVDGGPRYVVVDYKTNRLAPPSEPLVLGHYGPAATAQAMRDAHYPLQLLLYLVALHRFLRWRQPGYDPETHLAGGLYLFVRGMAGPGTPRVDGTPCGVVGWRPPPPLVVELSDLLHGASERPARLEAAAGAGGRPR
jgi:exodeoxyribonuclease V beta subunit